MDNSQEHGEPSAPAPSRTATAPLPGAGAVIGTVPPPAPAPVRIGTSSSAPDEDADDTGEGESRSDEESATVPPVLGAPAPESADTTAPPEEVKPTQPDDSPEADADAASITAALIGRPDPAPAAAPTAAATATPAATAAPAATATETATAAAAETASVATAASTAAAEAGADAEAEAEAEATAAPSRIGRLTRPSVAAAAVVGALLLATPFLVTSLRGGSSSGEGAPHPGPAWHQGQPGGSGLVPGAATPAPGSANGSSTGGGSSGSGGSGGKATGAGGGKALTPADALAGGGHGPVDTGTSGGSGSSGSGGSDAGTSHAPGSGSSSKPAAHNPSSAKTGTATSGKPTPAPPATHAAVAPPPKPTSYTQWAGPYCGSDVYYVRHNYFSDGSERWTTSSGGYDGSMCSHGTYYSLPMSGSASKDDPDNTNVTWEFTSLGGITDASCHVSVWIPDASSVTSVGGTAAYYTVHDGSTNGAASLGHFTIDQVTHEGGWALGGQFQVHHGAIAVELHSRGVDYDGYSGSDKPRLAADVVKITCTAD